MTHVAYTHHWETGNSTAVDNVYYNENNKKVYIDWDDEVYEYSNVTLAEAQAVVNGGGTGGSIGRAAARLKNNKGPGRHLGNWWNLSFDEVLTGYAEHRATRAAAKVNAGTPTRAYSLQTPAAPASVSTGEATASVTVFFTLEGTSTVHEFVAQSDDVYEAIEELNQFVSRLKTTGKVTKAVVDFA